MSAEADILEHVKKLGSVPHKFDPMDHKLPSKAQHCKDCGQVRAFIAHSERLREFRIPTSAEVLHRRMR